jgi:hypothetical protein
MICVDKPQMADRNSQPMLANRSTYGRYLYLVLGFLIVLFSLTHVMVLVTMVGENSDNASILSVTSDDSAQAVKVAVRTKWFNDNRWRSYGPLYYRIAHSVSWMVPYFKTQDATPLERAQTRNHFSLMIVSLISLALTCYVIAGFFALGLAERIGVASVFLSLFLADKTFSSLILLAHPDHLLTLLTALLFVSAYGFVKCHTRLRLVFIGITFGLMLSTKLTAILFIPGLCWIFFDKQDAKGSLNAFKVFLFSTTAAYFIIGFPQNFLINKAFSFLKYQSQFSTLSDGTSLVEWARLFKEQMWKPFVFSLVLHLFYQKNSSPELETRPLNRPYSIKLVLLAVFPLIALVSRKIYTRHDYYTFPFAILFLLTFNALIKDRFSLGFISRFYGMRMLLILLAVPFFSAWSNAHFALNLREHTRDRSYYREIQAWIAQKAQGGKTVLLTPYVPFPQETKGIVTRWAYTFDAVKEIEYSAMALNKKMYIRYLKGDEPNEIVKADYRDWRPIREFFSYFVEGNNVRTPDGKNWRIVSDKFDIQLWEENYSDHLKQKQKM